MARRSPLIWRDRSPHTATGPVIKRPSPGHTSQGKPIPIPFGDFIMHRFLRRALGLLRASASVCRRARCDGETEGTVRCSPAQAARHRRSVSPPGLT